MFFSNIITEMKISDKTIVVTLLIIKLYRRGEPSMWSTVSFLVSQYLKKLASPKFSKELVCDI